MLQQLSKRVHFYNIDPELDTDMRELIEYLIEFQQEELALQKYRLEHEIPETVFTPIRFSYVTKGLFFLITIFTAVFAANTIIDEYNMGTIRQIFIKPVRRESIYLAKFVASVVITIIFAVWLLFISMLFGYIFFGENSISVYEVVVINGEITTENMLISVLHTNVLNLFKTIIVSGISLCVASVTKSNILSLLAILACLWGHSILGDIFGKNAFYQNFIISNLSFEGYLPGGTLPYDGATLTKSIIICFIYLIICLFIGKYFFGDRDVY